MFSKIKIKTSFIELITIQNYIRDNDSFSWTTDLSVPIFVHIFIYNHRIKTNNTRK